MRESHTASGLSTIMTEPDMPEQYMGRYGMLSKRAAEVERSRCVACGACARVCPRQAIRVMSGCWAAVERERCVGCGRCEKICPAGCITLQERGATA